MSSADASANFRNTVLPGADAPLTTFSFIVMIGTRPLGDFAKVSGIKYDLPTEKVYEGGRYHSPHILPFGDKGAGLWNTVTLEWGSPVWSVLYDWIQAVQVGAMFRRDVTILQLKPDGWPSRIMRLKGAFPVAWQAPDLDTTSKANLEKLTLAFDSMNHVLTGTSLPGLNALAAMAGRIAAVGRVAGEGFVDGLISDAEDAASLFDPSTYDSMEEAFNGAYESHTAGLDAGGDQSEESWSEGGFSDPETDAPDESDTGTAAGDFSAGGFSGEGEGEGEDAAGDPDGGDDPAEEDLFSEGTFSSQEDQ